jgi:opacity protein-like surface antigen
MNTKSKITLVAAVLTTLAAPAFAAAVVPEFPGELAQPIQAQSWNVNASQSYASSRSQYTPRTAPTRSWEEQRSFDRGSAVIN